MFFGERGGWFAFHFEGRLWEGCFFLDFFGTKLLQNTHWEFHIYKSSTKVYYVRKKNSKGKTSWNGGKDLSSSALFPLGFCRAVLRCWECRHDIAVDTSGFASDFFDSGYWFWWQRCFSTRCPRHWLYVHFIFWCQTLALCSSPPINSLVGNGWRRAVSGFRAGWRKFGSNALKHQGWLTCNRFSHFQPRSTWGLFQGNAKAIRWLWWPEWEWSTSSLARFEWLRCAWLEAGFCSES